MAAVPAFAGVGATVLPVAVPAPSSGELSAPPVAAEPYGGFLDRRALRLVAVSIGLGGVLQLIALWLAHREIEPESLIRYDIVLTLALYAVVGVLVVSQITPTVRLRWGEGSLAGRIALGAGFGAVVGGTLLALVSAAAGHLSPDPRIVLMMSEGDPSHILVAIGISCVAAPLVEETLFRGILLESLLPRGVPLAVVGSAFAFAVWHFMPSSIVYYTVLGAALAGLYVKRGLACSMAAHAAFNGVLTVAAIAVVLAPSQIVHAGDLTLNAPGGWTVAKQPPSPLLLAMRGPSGAVVEALEIPTPVAQDASSLLQRIDTLPTQVPAGVSLKLDQARLVEVDDHEGVAVDLDAAGHHGTMVLVPEAPDSYELVFMSAGSAKATQDFESMMNSVRLA